jgi:hypothetical protein
MRTLAAALAFTVLSCSAAAAQQGQRCTHESFPVGGQQVAITLCAGAPSGGTVAVSETFKGSSASFSRQTSIDVLPGAAVSRTIDDVALAPLGLAYTLHLTLAFRDGTATVEHALLLPGAVPLK